MKKDNVDLICSVAELVSLFESTSNLEEFLGKVVSMVAYHMRAAVCSIYLYDEDRKELVLRANQGLNPDFVGRMKIQLGEGITGTALGELRAIRESDATRNPHFKHVPGLNEEPFRAFLAVPIVRGLTRIGVLVVQDSAPGYFDEKDAKALRAIAAQLATTIENAELLMSLRASEEPQSKPASVEPPAFIKGIGIAGGWGFGRAAVLDEVDADEFTAEGLESARHTLDDFQRALVQTEQQLEVLQRQMEERLADVGSLIFSAHLLILKDEQFSGQMEQMIRAGTPPADAVVGVVNQYVNLFSKSPNARLREKVQDVKDLGHRILHNLFGEETDSADYSGHILVCGSLLPSDIMKIMAQKAVAIILVGSSSTAHVAILARSLQIPMVIIAEKKLLEVPENTMLLIDAEQGSVFVNPPDEVVEKYRSLEETHRQADQEERVEAETYSRDGARVRLLANVNLLSDLKVARKLKAEGVGLYRSEFPFIVRNDFPSEEEQCRIYHKIVEEMEGREVVFRTLDIGGDKMLSYYPSVDEANPFLGLRAIRFSLRNRDIFSQQLRALLRAGAGADIRIMFPLIASVDDVIQAKEILAECSNALRAEKAPYCENPQVGVMVELPSAVEIAADLAAEADFLCIGTNDLIQYILAVDRTNEQIAHLYVSHHPAVLRSINRVALAARERGVDLSICGDMATDERMIPFLLGIGIRKLSMDARRIPAIQKRIGQIDIRQAEKAAQAMLAMSRVAEVEEFLQQDCS